MGIGDKVKSEGMKFGMKAFSKLMEDPQRADRVMKAVSTAQNAKAVVDDTTHKLLNASNLIAAKDLDDLSKQAGRIKREAKKAAALLDDIEARLAG
jgi:hypothetical protein